MGAVICNGRRPDTYKLVTSEDPGENGQKNHPAMKDQYWSSQVAAGKAMQILESQGRVTISVEAHSVYGAALVMPQLARTSGWALTYTALAIRSYLGMVLNVIIQGYLLYMLSKEERLLDKYAGQMHLCDFGAHLEDCSNEDTPNCIGPGGTRYTYERLYNWNQWATRVYVKQALLDLFPEMRDDIVDKVDPGEYGLESHLLRTLCCFIFVVGLWSDLVRSTAIVQMLWYVPTKHEPWIIYEVPEWDTKDRMKKVRGWSELDFVKFRIAGMPGSWKVMNTLFLVFPKVYLWVLTVDIGVVYLMETSTISDMIINAVALAFILSIDELLASVLMSHTTQHVLSLTENFYPFEGEAGDESDIDCFEFNEKDKDWNICTWRFYKTSFPMPIVGPLLCTLFFMCKYYREHCVTLEDGSWVSKAVRKPLVGDLPLTSFLFGPFPMWFPIGTAEEPMWEMPDSR